MIYWKSVAPWQEEEKTVGKFWNLLPKRNLKIECPKLGFVAGSHSEEGAVWFYVITKWPSKSQWKRKHLAAKPSPLLSWLQALVQPHALPKPLDAGGQGTQGITASLKWGIIYIPLPRQHSDILLSFCISFVDPLLLVLVGYGRSSEQNVLESGQGG